MNYPTITIEGTILSSEILDRLEADDTLGQKPSEYGLKPGARVKDEIARAWAESRLQWKIFQSKKERVRDDATGTSETRQFWIVPLLDTLGFHLAKTPRAEVVNGESYDISHVDPEIDDFPVMVMGWRDSLDVRRESGGPRLSPHALVQEYLNLTEHLYAIVTNGHRLRLLRDSSRLTRLSYLEFDLEGMMEREAYADFAIFFRLLHRTRMPVRQEEAGTSIIEHYHQQALESGARIRDGLSRAVQEGLQIMGNGLLEDPANTELRARFATGELDPRGYFTQLLRTIYRLLFLFVVEERDLIYPRNETPDGQISTDAATTRFRDIYNRFYAAGRLRRLAEERHLVDAGEHDLWFGLFTTFQLFENETIGSRLGIAALDGELFGADALADLVGTRMRNQYLLHALWLLTQFRNDRGDWVRINYAALNVEEFGSVYEGLLDLEPEVSQGTGSSSLVGWGFRFVEGDERGNTGSHYTPDELVRPLVEHALDPVIEASIAEARKRKDAAGVERALLSLKVCDVACGSGHFLLAAARRIGYVLARTRTGEDQPNPRALREATRDAIAHCIYGVDKNPMAVELCRVALWLEAHNPGKPLTFLDHRIRVGDAIVGVARAEDLDRGIPDEAFTATPDDTKATVSALRKRNKAERGQGNQITLTIPTSEADLLHQAAAASRKLDAMPDSTLTERKAKQQAYTRLRTDSWWGQKTLADLATAQFFLRKTPTTVTTLCTDAAYRALRETPAHLVGNTAAAAAVAISEKKRFFHWFLEFPEVFERGGFDCVLGNPPFLGGQRLSGTYGHDYLTYLKTSYPPAGAIDLVGYFFRRIFNHLRPGGALGCIATNTLAQGGTREGSLAVILEHGGTINYAIRSMKWPGRAGVEVALATLHKGEWKGSVVLDGREVEQVNSYLSDDEPLGDPLPLLANKDKSFQGSTVLGKGFVLEPEVAAQLLEQNPKNRDVLFPYLNGEDLNSRPDQSPSRRVINFHDWPETKAREYPECFDIIERLVKPERAKGKRKTRREFWWQFAERAPKLYRTIAPLERVLVVAQISRTLAFDLTLNNKVLDARLVVFAFDDSGIFALLQSSVHHYWAWKYCTTLKTDLTYAPTRIFQTFPFPADLDADLEIIGGAYHTLRAEIMHHLQLGLTKTYNLFHTESLTTEQIIKQAKCDPATANRAKEQLEELRKLHAEMDEAVKAAYGWDDIALEHGYHEVDFLPENDRTRYTISPIARKEILRRLLLLNHERYAEEQRGKGEEAPRGGRTVGKGRGTQQQGMFGGEDTASTTKPTGGTKPTVEPRKATPQATPAVDPPSTPPTADFDYETLLFELRPTITEHGALEREELIKAIATRLGYQRTGKAIRENIESAINAGVRRGIIVNEGGYYTIATRTIEEYDRDTLTRALLAVLHITWHNQDEAIRETTRYLGFRRTGSVIQETFVSIIRGAIRKGVLERDGGDIRRRR